MPLYDSFSKHSFLKWAGSKRQVLPALLPLFIKARRFVEPFMGSGVVFLNTNYSEYLLADVNPDIIALFKQLQTEGESFIKYCAKFFAEKNNTAEVYYDFRKQFNATTIGTRRRAALFVYLNRHGYNGLCRYNSTGIFNVPFGRYHRLNLPEESMRFAYEKAKKATFLTADFMQLLDHIRKGDCVYCDPPYLSLDQKTSFTAYAPLRFSTAEHERLRAFAYHCRDKGATVILSNHDTAEARSLYQDADKLIAIDVHRKIAAEHTRRQLTGEVIAVYDGARVK